MKKQFYHRQNNLGERSPEPGLDAPGTTVDSTLYAAEFMLYAFHFDDQDFNTGSKPANAHPIMILVTEG